MSPRYQAPGGGAKLKGDSKLQAGDGGEQAWGKPGVPQELMSLSSQWWSGRKPCDVGNACSSGQTARWESLARIGQETCAFYKLKRKLGDQRTADQMRELAHVCTQEDGHQNMD